MRKGGRRLIIKVAVAKSLLELLRGSLPLKQRFPPISDSAPDDLDLVNFQQSPLP